MPVSIFLLIFASTSCQTIPVVESTMAIDRFQRETLCYDNVDLLQETQINYENPTTGGSLQAAFACSKDEECVGYMMNTSGVSSYLIISIDAYSSLGEPLDICSATSLRVYTKQTDTSAVPTTVTVMPVLAETTPDSLCAYTYTYDSNLFCLHLRPLNFIPLTIDEARTYCLGLDAFLLAIDDVEDMDGLTALVPTDEEIWTDAQVYAGEYYMYRIYTFRDRIPWFPLEDPDVNANTEGSCTSAVRNESQGWGVKTESCSSLNHVACSIPSS